MKALWNGKLIAQSTDTVVVEGNHYFPLISANAEYFRPSSKTTICPWKGTAHYYTLVVDGQTNPDAVWYYPDPSAAAMSIRGRIAFWRGVEVVGD